MLILLNDVLDTEVNIAFSIKDGSVKPCLFNILHDKTHMPCIPPTVFSRLSRGMHMSYPLNCMKNKLLFLQNTLFPYL